MDTQPVAVMLMCATILVLSAPGYASSDEPETEIANVIEPEEPHSTIADSHGISTVSSHVADQRSEHPPWTVRLSESQNCGHGSLVTGRGRLVPCSQQQQQRGAPRMVGNGKRFVCRTGIRDRGIPCKPPAPGNLNPNALLERLGSDFDKTWTSVEPPNQPDPSNTTEVRTPIDRELYEVVAGLDYSYRDEKGTKHAVKPSVRRYMEKWLLQRSSCPIRLIWHDLGESFWPRWVRWGVCDTAASCSLPPGMHCAPERSRTLFLLRWNCQELRTSRAGRSRSRGGKRAEEKELRCQWKKVPYPVTTGCYCSC